jgi:hypothetical protein
MYSLGLIIAPRISFKLVKSRVKQALSRCKMTGAGFHSISKFHAQIRNTVMADRGIFQAYCHKSIYHTADCHSQMSEFESGMP